MSGPVSGPVTAGHLGGYLPGGDPATQFPALWDWLVDELAVRSVVDVGCGDGQAVEHFRRRGCHVVGIDGVPQDDESIVAHDYTEGVLRVWPDRGRSRPFDLCWSCEFVEHVAEPYRHNFLTTFACAELLLMTHATPGQPGYHHVNCQPREYWMNQVAYYGFELDEQLTVRTRILAAQTDHDWNQYVRSGLAFRRNP